MGRKTYIAIPDGKDTIVQSVVNNIPIIFITNGSVASNAVHAKEGSVTVVVMVSCTKAQGYQGITSTVGVVEGEVTGSHIISGMSAVIVIVEGESI